jgi:hypothetical protein
MVPCPRTESVGTPEGIWVNKLGQSSTFTFRPFQEKNTEMTVKGTRPQRQHEGKDLLEDKHFENI